MWRHNDVRPRLHAFALVSGMGALTAAIVLGSCSRESAKTSRRAGGLVPAVSSTSPSAATALAEPKPASTTAVTKVDFEAAVADPDPKAVDRLIAKLPRFADGEGHEYLVFEGDLPYSEQQVRALVEQERAKRRAQSPRTSRPELKLELGNPGERLIWAWPERHLTFAVDKVSFNTAPPHAYELVVQSIEAAAAQWEGLCSACALTIRHQASFDAHVDRSKVTFVVSYSAAPSVDIALAFFPGAPPDQRTLWVYSRYPVTSFDKVGVFRHELGHVLGYAHEHLDQLSGCAKTSDAWSPITRYDAKSAMHYVCGSEGSLELAFTDCDKKGHLRTYGAPAGSPPPTGLPPLDCRGVPL